MMAKRPAALVLIVTAAGLATLGVWFAGRGPDLSSTRADSGFRDYNVYMPPGDRSGGVGCPTVLVVHGGCGVWGDKSWPAPTALSRWLARDGFRVVNVNYRLAPGAPYPAAIMDVEAVARDFSRDRPVFLIGISYGALLAEAVAAMQPHQVRGLVALSGVHDPGTLDNPWLMLSMGPTSCTSGLVRSPLRQATGAFPPTLLVHGDVDRVVPFEQASFAARTLRALGCEVSLIRLAGCGHVDDFKPTVYRIAYPYIRAWLAARCARANPTPTPAGGPHAPQSSRTSRERASRLTLRPRTVT